MKLISTQKQYLEALRKLGLTPASKATTEALGLGLRQCQRFSGKAPCAIPGPVQRLLAMYLAHGLPELD